MDFYDGLRLPLPEPVFLKAMAISLSKILAEYCPYFILEEIFPGLHSAYACF